MTRHRFVSLCCMLSISTLGSCLGAEAAEKPATAAAGKAPSDDGCPDCKGKGKIPCPRCRYGKVKVACSKCNGTGRMECPAGCNDGKITCPRCNGTGSRRAIIRYKTVIEGDIVKRERKIPIWGTVSCPKTVDCPECRGKGTKTCDLCGGNKWKSAPCPECSGKGKGNCPRCEGTGRLTAGPIPNPEPDPRGLPGGEDSEGLLVTLRSAVAIMRRCQDREAKSKDTLANVSEKYKRLSKIADMKGYSQADQDKILKAHQEWIALGTKIEALQRDFQTLQDGAPEFENRLRDMQSLLVRLGNTKGQQVSGQSIQDHHDYAVAHKTKLDNFDRRMGELDKSLGELQGEVNALEKTSRKKKETEERDRKKKEEILEAYAKVEEAVTAMADVAELPEFTISLDEKATRSSRELHVEMKYLDNEAKDRDDEKEIEPSERYLEKIPEVVKEALSTQPEVKSILFYVRARHLTKTGIPQSVPIQRLSIGRHTWDQLMAGAYKDDWRRILAACNPDPPYPRKASGPLGATELVILFLALLAVAGLVLILARRG